MTTTITTTTTVTETKRRACRPVICLNTGEWFPMIKDAARYYGFTDCAIWNQLNGKQRTVKGLKFCYAENYETCEAKCTSQPECDDLAELKRKAAAYDAIMAQREMTHRLADLKAKRDKIETEIKNLEQQLESLGGIL